MNALPCYADIADARLARELGKEAAREDAVSKLADELERQYCQDLDQIEFAFGNVGVLPRATLLDILVLIRDGSNDTELGKRVRELTMAELHDMAVLYAEDELS